MDENALRADEDEVAALEHDRERIDTQLRSPLSAAVESMLRDERRWVERRKRALERVQVSARAALHAGERVMPCEVRDVSAHGAGIDADVQPRVGDRVRLELVDLDGKPTLDAVVRHVTGRRVGLEFDPHGDRERDVAAELERRFAAREG